MADEILALAHEARYVAAIAGNGLSAAEQRAIGFPWSEAMVERARRSVGATLAAARAALVEGVAANLAGGTHHASAGRGSGYCVFNDVAVAARAVQADAAGAVGGVAMPRIVVIDLDVHQGDGTAAIFPGDPSVLHGVAARREELPLPQGGERPRRRLPDGCGDAAYLVALDAALTASGASTHCDRSAWPSTSPAPTRTKTTGSAA